MSQMKTLTLAIIVALIALSGVSYARLFENKGQCELRYGASSICKTGETGSEICLYSSEPYSIAITFVYGIAHQIVYEHKTLSRFPEDQATVLLEANRFGSSWKEAQYMPYYWDRADGRAIAFITGDKLFISSQEYYQRIQNEKKQKLQQIQNKF